MNKPKLGLTIIFLASLALPGCARPEHVKTMDNLCLTGPDRQEALIAAEDVLSRMHFTIEKFDTDAGYIRTRPLPAAQSFEFWRSDNVGQFNSSEADLHTIRRTVEITAGRSDNQLCLECTAHVQRLSLLERDVATGRAYAIFSQSRHSLQSMKLSPEQKSGFAWIELGRDNQLETEILKQIRTTVQADNGAQEK